MRRYSYPPMVKHMGDFELTVEPGEFTDSEIIVMLGENGTGKTTLIRLMAGYLKPDEGGTLPLSSSPLCHNIRNSSLFKDKVPSMNVSYKPQKITPKSAGTVRQLLHKNIRDSYVHPQFVTDVIKPLQVDTFMDQEVLNLSGGELQRVALTLALGQVS